ncbi:MAG: ribosome small subunit-dependent GTPase A [Clostridia bacterium]|nr:ribosome small subunit-dependent GTPase A [Clostridia bacterium]
MELKVNGKIIKGVGGLYSIRLNAGDADKLRCELPLEGDILLCKGRGVFRHEKLTLLAGDNVTVRVDTELMLAGDRDARASHAKRDTEEADAGVLIDEVLPRKNELIRPPMANLDLLFVVFAAAKPQPILQTIDKLITIAEYKKLSPVIIITKADLAPDAAEEYAALYRKCGFDVFIEGEGMDGSALENFIRQNADKVSAFAGASGVGKSTLMNRLFPSLGLTTGEISAKTARGKHTTRHIELYPLDRQFGEGASGYIADTPGFSMLDFVQYDFYTKDDLPYVFREFEPYIGRCRYTKCTHTKEEGCALLEAVKNGEIPKERHESYLAFYEVLKNKHDWDRK